MNLKKLMLLLICLAVVFPLAIPNALAETSPPIAQGKTKKHTYIYWGKDEAFPTIASLSSGEIIDIYEYDSKWILTKHKTWVTYNGETSLREFYGYVKRADIVCEPPLKGEKSQKADTGPGKRKGRPPKKRQPEAPPETPPEEETPQPDEPTPPIPIEDLLEYDWIIRTPGVCSQTIDFGDGAKFKAQFSLMAIKFGGYTASSLPVFNDGHHNPYVGYVSFSLNQSMQELVDEMDLDILKGTGGISIESFNSDARFHIDSQTDNGTKTIITIKTLATSTLNPQITDEFWGLVVGGELFQSTQVMPLDIKLEPSGSGYLMVLLNMRPGGGDLKFPAMLEKFPLSDIDKAERERIQKEKDEEARRKAREAQKKALEELKKKLDEEFEDESNLPTEEGKVKIDNWPKVVPLVPEVDKSTDWPKVVPLVPEDDNKGKIKVVPLTGGGTSEEVEFFPGD